MEHVNFALEDADVLFKVTVKYFSDDEERFAEKSVELKKSDQ